MEINNKCEKCNECNEVDECSESSENLLNLEQQSKPLSKEELRKKLKHRISSARGSRKNGISRKKAENLQDSLGKVNDILKDSNIDDPSKIDASLIQNIMNIINKEDLETILNKIKEDSKFKNILQQVTEASSQIKLES